jgi:hypothetical protein
MMLAKDLKIIFAFGGIFWQRVVFVCILLSAEVVSRRRSRWAVRFQVWGWEIGL